MTVTAPCEPIAAAGMSHAEFQDFRHEVKGLGASDAAVALGLSPWRSAYNLWCELTGEIDPVTETEPMHWGHVMEPVIAAEFFDRHPELEDTPLAATTFRSLEHGVMFASPDRLATSKRTGHVTVVELKNVGFHMSGDWGDYPPDYVQIQVQHQLAVMGLDQGWVAALIGGNDFRDYLLARDDELIAALIETERVFYQHVLDMTPPPVDDSESTAEALREEWAASDPDSVIELGREFATDLLHKRESAEAAKKAAEADLNMVKNTFMAAMGEYEIGTVDGLKAVTWKRSERHSLDSKALKAEMPDIHKEFEKVTPVRTLKFCEQKEGEA